MSVLLALLAAALAALAAWLGVRLRRSEARARSAEDCLAQALEALPGAAQTYGPDERLTAWNEEAAAQHARFGGALQAGVPLAQVLEAMARSGLVAEARGREADWTAERIARFRAAPADGEERSIGDRRLMVRLRRLADGGRLVACFDVTEARAREAALAESERRFRQLAEVSSDWFWRTDSEHRFLPDTEETGRGAGPGQPGAKRWEVADPADLLAEPDKWARHYDDLAARREFRDFRYWAIDGDGRRLYVRTSGRPAFGADGSFQGYRGVSSDLTPQVVAETFAAAAQARLAAAIETLPLAVALYDQEDRLVVCNSRCREFFPAAAPLMKPGAARLDVLRAVADRGDIDGWEGRGAEWRDAIERSGERGEASFDLRLANGRSLTRMERPTPDGGRVIAFADVSELKQGQDELARTSRQMQVVFENLAEGVSVVDADLNVVAFNRMGLAMLGFPETAFARFEDYIRFNAERGEYGPGEVDALVAERVALARQFVPHAFERVRPDGTVIEVRGNPIAGGGFVTTYRDVTEQRRVEETLRKAKEQAELASRAKSEFLANTSHELRTPLNAIIGFSEIILQQMFGPLGSERYLEYARDIHHSGAHLLSIINDLLDLAKVEAGRFDMTESEIALRHVVDASVRFVRDRADAAGVELVVDVDRAAPRLFADERAVKQIVLNLLSNAVKFTLKGGRVAVSVRLARDGWLEVSVGDTGIGMSPEEIEIALTPFGQVESALNRRYEGTGLGLPLVRRFVELHGGRLKIESRTGIGTTATARFPPERLVWPEPVRAAGGAD